MTVSRTFICWLARDLANIYRHSGPRKMKPEVVDWKSWVTLFPGIDFPREMGWMEVRRMFGGGIMAVGMD